MEPAIDEKSSDDDIGKWLTWRGLATLVEQFRENEIDGDVFFALTDTNFKELNIKMGPRNKIQRKIGHPAQGGRGGGGGGGARAVSEDEQRLACQLLQLKIKEQEDAAARHVKEHRAKMAKLTSGGNHSGYSSSDRDVRSGSDKEGGKFQTKKRVKDARNRRYQAMFNNLLHQKFPGQQLSELLPAIDSSAFRQAYFALKAAINIDTWKATAASYAHEHLPSEYE